MPDCSMPGRFPCLRGTAAILQPAPSRATRRGVLKRPDNRKLASPRGPRYNPRMRLHRRRSLWLSAALLLAVVAGAWLLVPRSRITQANYDRIQEGMSD